MWKSFEKRCPPLVRQRLNIPQFDRFARGRTPANEWPAHNDRQSMTVAGNPPDARVPAIQSSIAVIAASFLILLTGCQRGEPAPVRNMWTVMGTFAAISLPATGTNRLAAATAQAKTVLAELEQRLSVYRPDSEISRLNAAAGTAPAPLSADTLDLLRRVRRYSEASGGAFDPTLGPVIRAWGFSGGKTPATIPSQDTLRVLLDRTGWRRLQVGETTASLPLAGMFVDLGGIAKGYAVDRVLDALAPANYPNVLMDLGGNVRCRGEPRPGVPWRIGVRNPFAREEIIGILRIPSGMAVATSGNYERFVEINGERYTHIIDPRTGWPVKGMASVTVVSPDGTESDALSTALFVAGVKEAKDILARLPGNEALFIRDERPPQLLASPGFRRIFEPASEWAPRLADW
jgi:thiamine biosynthesis lipoprotein